MIPLAHGTDTRYCVQAQRTLAAKAAKKPALALGVAFASYEQAEPEDDGRHFTLRRLARTEADSDYPVLLRKGAQLFVLWNTTEKRHVATL